MNYVREGETSYDIPYMLNLKRNDTNKLTYKQTHRLREQTMVAREKYGEKKQVRSSGSTRTCCYI